MKKPKPVLPLAFEQDHRTTNPGLHTLHVFWAIEELKTARQCVDDLYAMSRFPANHWAHALHSAMRESVLSDAAFFEAAALLWIHEEGLVPDPDDDQPIQEQRV